MTKNVSCFPIFLLERRPYNTFVHLADSYRKLLTIINLKRSGEKLVWRHSC